MQMFSGSGWLQKSNEYTLRMCKGDLAFFLEAYTPMFIQNSFYRFEHLGRFGLVDSLWWYEQPSYEFTHATSPVAAPPARR